MELKLIKIGNSKGVRLPKSVLDAVGPTDGFELAMDGKVITLVPHASGAFDPPPIAEWSHLIQQALEAHGDDADEFADWDATLSDGLDDL